MTAVTSATRWGAYTSTASWLRAAPNALQRQRIAALTRALAWALIGAWLLASTWFPFGWDQGMFATTGRTILQGGMPYRDAFDIKGPATYYLYALAQALFGDGTWSIRLVDASLQGAAAWLIGSLVARHTDRGAGTWAAALYLLWFASLGFWNTAQPDGAVAAITCLAFVPMLRDGPSRSRARDLTCGALIGLTGLFKPQYLAFMLVPAAYLASHAALPVRARRARLTTMAMGAATVVGAMLGLFWWRDALDALLEVHLLYNLEVYATGAGSGLAGRVRGSVEYLLQGGVFVMVVPAVLFGAWRLRRDQLPVTLALLSWALIAYASVALQNKFFAYQWAPLFPPVVALTAVGLHAALRTAPDAPVGMPVANRGFVLALFYLILVHASVHPLAEVANVATRITGVRDERAFRAAFGVERDWEVARYLRHHAAPGDRLFVMGWHANVLYESGLQSPSRHLYSMPLWMGRGTELQARYRGELMQTMHARAPEFVVLAPQAVPLLGRQVRLDEFPEFLSLVTERYRMVAQFGDFTVHRLRSAGLRSTKVGCRTRLGGYLL